MRCVDLDAVSVRSFERCCRRSTRHDTHETGKKTGKVNERKNRNRIIMNAQRMEWMRINDTHSNGLRFYVHAFVQSWTSPCQIYRFAEVAECTQSGFPFRFKWILSGTNREKKGNKDLQTHTFHVDSVDFSVDSLPSFLPSSRSIDSIHFFVHIVVHIFCVPKHTLMYIQCSTKMIHACMKSAKFR